MSPARNQDSPGVHIPPPLFFVAGFFAGWVLNRVWPVAILSEPLPLLVTRALLIMGAVIFAAGFISFVRHKTAISPAFGATKLITDGPYRFSRNPIYLGFTMIYLSAIVRTNILWTLLFLPFLLLFIDRYLIRREERHLTAVFGDSYREYCQQVGRWF